MGDTLLETRNAADPLDGFQEVRPMVYSGIYPINSADYEHLKNNLAKLQLNDPAFIYQQESSIALGFGFRCGSGMCTWRLFRNDSDASMTWISSPHIQMSFIE